MKKQFKEIIQKQNYKFFDNVLAFQKGPLSQWYGGFPVQNGGFVKAGISYNCCEQYMMHLKALLFHDIETAEKILKSKNPREQKAYGRSVKNFDQTVWDNVKEDIVFTANRAKYENVKNVEFREIIDNIPDFCIIVEAAPWDPIWGNGIDIFSEDTYDITKWKGTNLLGRCLMNLVTYTRSEKRIKEIQKNSENPLAFLLDP